MPIFGSFHIIIMKGKEKQSQKFPKPVNTIEYKKRQHSRLLALSINYRIKCKK